MHGPKMVVRIEVGGKMVQNDGGLENSSDRICYPNYKFGANEIHTYQYAGPSHLAHNIKRRHSDFFYHTLTIKTSSQIATISTKILTFQIINSYLSSNKKLSLS